MTLLNRIMALVKPASQQSFAGYTLRELQTRFPKPLSSTRLPAQPTAASLEYSGVFAGYVALLTTVDEFSGFRGLVESSFQKIDERVFDATQVFEYEDPANNQRLLFSTSTEEFKALTIRLVTNSDEFLDRLAAKRVCVPPPWIAFEEYNPAWWGGNMQGAQGYYNDQYFYPFFTRLSEAEKRAYFAKFDASDEWIAQLTLMYDDED